MSRIFNFSAGPCTLPLEVLEAAKAQFVDFNGTGMSLIEMSHRSKTVEAVHDRALALVRETLSLPANYHVLFLGAGATFQFAMVPLNLLHGGKSADYTHSGAWAKKAIADAKLIGKVNTIFDGKDSNYMTLPDPKNVRASAGVEYLHLTSNETIGGVQWKDFPSVDVPLVSDMSSDIMSRPIPIEKFGLIYAGAQKNIGPAGVALVIIRDDMLAKCPGNLPNYMNYAEHVSNNSMLNTPPVFQIWMIQLVLEWLKGKGGLAWAQDMATKRSKILYDAINKHAGYYKCPVDERYRSTMNVVWRLPSEELEGKFCKEATAAGLDGLKGHRSVGGCRASIYNAMPIEGAQALAQFMDNFATKNG
ncbi:MAG: 3-phosphoserine/phosphohydroxythreonine transaminase [Planctomycetes bacterium]|nr:3-phosphoserine/phosphohydroxythreonine transaminase [Planctomycetota bacterium]